MSSIINTPVLSYATHYLEIGASVAIILFSTWLTAKVIRKAFYYYIDREKVIQYNFFIHLITIIVYFIGIFSAITMIPLLQSAAFSILASSGILALIAGFASQQAFANIISGFFIELSVPFKIGDRIKVNKDFEGIVEDITLRHTILKIEKNQRILIPNSILNTAIIENFSWNKK